MQQYDKSEKAKQHNGKFLWTVFGVILALISFTLLVLVIYRFTFNPNWEAIFAPFLGISGGIIIVALMFLYSAFAKRCPSCHALNAEVGDVTNKQELSRKKGYRTRTETQDIKNSDGDVIGKTERSYQVRVLTTTHLHYYHCKVCNHAWTKEKQTTSDNFDED